MVVEIRIYKGAVKVRQFGAVRLTDCVAIDPLIEDYFAWRTYDELKRVGEGIWEFVEVADLPPTLDDPMPN